MSSTNPSNVVGNSPRLASAIAEEAQLAETEEAVRNQVKRVDPMPSTHGLVESTIYIVPLEGYS